MYGSSDSLRVPYIPQILYHTNLIAKNHNVSTEIVSWLGTIVARAHSYIQHWRVCVDCRIVDQWYMFSGDVRGRRKRRLRAKEAWWPNVGWPFTAGDFLIEHTDWLRQTANNAHGIWKLSCWCLVNLKRRRVIQRHKLLRMLCVCWINNTSMSSIQRIFVQWPKWMSSAIVNRV